MSKQANNEVKAARIARLLVISESHRAIVSSVRGALFERDAIEYQNAVDAVFEVCTDGEILAIEVPGFGQLFDEVDVAEIRSELS